MDKKDKIDKIRVVLIEDCKELCELLKHQLSLNKAFQVVGVAHDGKEGLEFLMNTEADVALIDIILPSIDGLGILEELKAKNLKNMPVFIMLTAISHEGLMQKALSLGADYFILKPFDMAVLTRRIIEIYEFKSNKTVGKQIPTRVCEPANPDLTIDEVVSDLLHKVGISPTLNGYTYLKTAISLTYHDRSMLEGITKVLYPTVAKKCNASPVRVERSIRHAIESSWYRGNQYAYEDQLGYFSPENSKPTNSNFICLVLEYYERYRKNIQNK